MTAHATPPRLNGFIRALESGKHALSLFAPCEVETAVELQGSAYDGIVFEGEHRGWDIRALRDSLQYLLNRAQIGGGQAVIFHRVFVCGLQTVLRDGSTDLIALTSCWCTLRVALDR